MTVPNDSPGLARLRVRLTLWYLATFGAILVLLGGGLFVVIRHQLGRQLDDSLREATAELARAARIREMESRTAHGQVVDAVDELHVPDRSLLLYDARGALVKPESGAPWLDSLARRAAFDGHADADHELPQEESLRAHAERFLLTSGTPMVAVAVADRVELEDRYAALIAAFGAAAAAALLLVAAGGWLLVRQSTTPVERTIAHMRRFMADAAHELRTPLTVLRTRAEVALQQPRDAREYTAALRAIEGESRRLGGIVENMLILARADAGERPIARERVFLDDLALDAVDAARALADGAGVALGVGTFDEAAVEGDATLLRQLVMILLDNAVKFTPRGGRVELNVGSTAGHSTLVVEDTGLGITAEQAPHVFERFYRADPARARATGAGLGLAIAKWIADAHGAAIDLASTPGEGTRVTVRFQEAGSRE